MNRFASTRSENRASHPCPGRAQCSVGSIDDDGIRYGFTTHALIASTIATAPAIVKIQSSATRQPCGRFGNRRSIGFLTSTRSPRARLLAPPLVDLRVVAGDEHVGYAPAAELGRPRVVRVLEAALERSGERLERARLLANRAGE